MGDTEKRMGPVDTLVKIRHAQEILQKAGVEHAGREAEEVIAHVLNTDRTAIYRDKPIIKDEEELKINELIQRRSLREPLQYLLGYAEFCGLRIKVGPGVLIPRPETELLVEEARRIFIQKALRDEKTCREGDALNILDLCTGSGCIALALAMDFPGSVVYGTDLSDIAIAYSEKNAELYGKGNTKFLRGSLYDPVDEMRFGLIVSNPPYIKKTEIRELQPEIRDWEPHGALDGGPDGLEYYRIIIYGAGKHLCSNGHLILEIGMGQAGAVRKMTEAAGLKVISIREDFSGIKRVFVAGTGS
jgi:release factor glutamine methyltransferase